MKERYRVGGVERYVIELSNALMERGHIVSVLSTRSSAHSSYQEIGAFEVMRIPYGIPLYNSSIPFGIHKHLSSNDYDVIHAHTPNPMIADLACIENRRTTPFILTYQNDITKNGCFGKIVSFLYNRTFGTYLLKNSNLIIATTRSYADKSKYLKRFKSKVRIIPNGVNAHRFNSVVNGNQVKTHFNVPRQSKVVLYIGALEGYKGLKYLITAFREVALTKSGVYLIIVGSGSLSAPLNELARELEISKNVIFAGYVPDRLIPQYYAACDVFVLPSVSEKEGFGMVQLEAMASGKPVICSDLPGMNEVDADAVASIHVPPQDTEALAQAMVTVLENEDLAIKMGRAGKKLVEQKYSWNRIAEMTENVYNEVLV